MRVMEKENLDTRSWGKETKDSRAPESQKYNK